MKKVINLSHREVNQFYPWPNDTRDTCLITVRDDLDMHTESINPKARLSNIVTRYKSVLRLDFHDTMNPYQEDGPRFVHASLIRDYVEKNWDCNFVVNCGAGRCRSGAMALALYWLGWKLEDWEHATSSANPRLVCLLSEAFNEVFPLSQ